MDPTDQQWAAIASRLPEKERTRSAPKGGRPFRGPRDVLNGVLWILRTGTTWADVPDRYLPYQTCHRRFRQWVEDGVLHRVRYALAEDLKVRGKVDLTGAYIDGSHAGAKRGGLTLGTLAATKITAVADRNGLSVVAWTASGERHEASSSSTPSTPASSKKPPKS
ncbi:MAG: transposase [Myxococcota bacterium]